MELLRHACKRDFWTFFLHAFGAQHNPKGSRWIEYDVHERLASWFQFHVADWMAKREHGRGEAKNLAVIVHREVGKTTLISQAGQAWLHLLDPEISTYTGGEKADLAKKTLESIKAVLDGSDPYALFTRLYGNWAENARKWTGVEVVHSARKNTARRDPSLGTFAVETSIVGAHPDAIFYDDPISYERLLSDATWLATVNAQVTSLYPVIQSDGLIVWVGTRYDDDDHFGVALKPVSQGGEGVRSVSGHECEMFTPEADGAWDLYFMAGRDKSNKPTTPRVWPEERLKRYQRRDPLRYAAQVMNDPAISEFNPLTQEQIQQCVVKADDVPYNRLRYYFCCDTAFWDGKSRARKDETVLIVQGLDTDGSGDVYIIEGYGSPTWRGEDFKNRLVSMTQRYRKLGRRIAGIVDEDPHGGKRGSWQSDLRNAFNDVNLPMPWYIELPRGVTQANRGTPGGNKIRRIVGAAHFWVDGHVRIIQGSPGSDRLMQQMSKIGQYMINPRLQNDWADAHSMIFDAKIYTPMRRHGPKSSYMDGARSIDNFGRRYDDDDWDSRNPAPGIGSREWERMNR